MPQEFRFLDGLDKSYDLAKRTFVARRGPRHRSRRGFNYVKRTRQPIAATEQNKEVTQTANLNDDDDLAAQVDKTLQATVNSSVLGQGRRDPFQTTARSLTHFEQTMIDAWMTVTNRNFDAPSARFSPQRNVLYSWVREDDLPMCAAILYGMKSLIATNVHVDDHLVVHYNSLVYNGINRRLSLEGHKPSLWLIGCILGILCSMLEIRGPDTDVQALKREVQVHIDGINVLIDLTGGWEVLTNLDAGFTWMLMWANTAVSGMLSFGRVIPAQTSFPRPACEYGRFSADLCRQKYTDELLRACYDGYLDAAASLWIKSSISKTVSAKNPLFLFRQGTLFFQRLEKNLKIPNDTPSMAVLFLVLIILLQCHNLPDHALNLAHELLWFRLDAIGSVQGGNSYNIIMALWTDMSSFSVWNVAAVEMLARHLWVESRVAPATQTALRQVLLSCLRPPDSMSQTPKELWSSSNLSQVIYQDLGLKKDLEQD